MGSGEQINVAKWPVFHPIFLYLSHGYITQVSTCPHPEGEVKTGLCIGGPDGILGDRKRYCHPGVSPPHPPTVHGVLPNEVAAPDIAKVTAFTRIKSGMASWYGKVLQNHLTASGRRFNMFELTAAHRDLPFGSRVRVTDLRNHRSVVVTITDRGVLDPDRVIDLSYGAAKQLQMIKSGVDPVTLDVLAIKGVPAVPRKPDDLDLDPTLATLQYPVDHR